MAKLRACYATPQALLADIFDFMSERQPADAVAWKEWMERQMAQFSASMTQALGGGGEDPKA